jgi:hypothetical protein
MNSLTHDQDAAARRLGRWLTIYIVAVAIVSVLLPVLGLFAAKGSVKFSWLHVADEPWLRALLNFQIGAAIAVIGGVLVAASAIPARGSCGGRGLRQAWGAVRRSSSS